MTCSYLRQVLASVFLLPILTWVLHELSPLSIFSTPENIIPVSAYYEPNRKAVRIYFLKHIKAHPTIYCTFASFSPSGLRVQTTRLQPTHTKNGWPFRFDKLADYRGTYLGFMTLCDIPPEVELGSGQNSLSVRLHWGAYPSNVQLSVQTGRINPNRSVGYKHRFGICLTPWFGTANYDPNFVIEYIELHRLMGVSQIVVYLAEEPRSELKRVLNMYTSHELSSVDGRNFELKLVNWMLPIEDQLNTLWANDQNLSFDDCLHRIGSETEFIFFGDFDEILVPNEGIQQKPGTHPTWNDVINKFAVHPLYRYIPTVCFPSYYFSPTNENNASERSIYDRTNATIEAYPERKKCMIRTALVEEVYVHCPVQPEEYVMGTPLAVIFHYRICLKRFFNLCGADTQYAPNNRLAAYRSLAQNAIALRRSALSDRPIVPLDLEKFRLFQYPDRAKRASTMLIDP